VSTSKSFLARCHPDWVLAGSIVVQSLDMGRDEVVYRELAPVLLAFATGLVGRDDAQDVVSSAVVKALAAPAWPAVELPRPYLFRAVVNEAHTWHRRAAQRAEREPLAGARTTWELPSFHPDVRAAVEQLSVQQRAAVLLTYWDDLDPRGVADHMGISEGSVRRHLARARARLRKVLDD